MGEPIVERSAAKTRRPVRTQHQEAPVAYLCIPDDQLQHLPKFGTVPKTMPAGSQLPRVGEVIYLTSASAWVVSIVIHEIVAGGGVRVELWIDWIGAARHKLTSPSFH